MSRISKRKVKFYSLVWYSALLSWCEAFSFFTRLVLPSNGIIFMTECILITLVPYLYPPPPTEISVFKNGIIECAFVSHFAGSFAFLQMLFWQYLVPWCSRWILQQAIYCAFGFLEERKCGVVTIVFKVFDSLCACVIGNSPRSFNTSSFLINFSEYGKNLNK